MERFFVNPTTGSVDEESTWLAEWQASVADGTAEEDGWPENFCGVLEDAGLIEVQRNYDDPDYGDWKPIEAFKKGNE